MLCLRLFGLNLPLVDIAFHPKIGRKPVGAHCAAWFYRCRDETMQGRPLHVRNGFEPNTTNPSTIFLDSNGNEHFILRQTPYQARFFSTPIGLIDFHDSRQTVTVRPNHGTAQLMHHHPRRLVASQPQNTLQTYGADAVLLAGHLPDGAKPDRQREMAVLKHSPGSNRHLVTAMATEPAVASHGPSFGCRATRTTPTARPTQCRQILDARLFAGKPLLQLQQRLGIILNHNPKHYRLGSVASNR